ncbi:protein S100-A12 [Callithrix jacchus]|uniref:Protein S100-A12 n=1 Tax=Callithrix jacchus TaxID=9483 RepID=F7IHU6_CALJA|nr:protein S100-A12 [Callithrix jacchus]XP_035135790.1 protein S100-A12 [Callithrix jacchus]XP_035135791.1 protein S100-A12 [Callithrix jacchus]XP_035135792.1 protein S100-A12 [Callithrix jacchus]
MTKLEEHLEGIVNIFHQYSVRTGNFDTLSKGELKQLMAKELVNLIKNAKDKATVDKTFQDLDANQDNQVNFQEFISLLAVVLKASHENIHKE